ncbi:MAG: SgcJ/EcaC family oxidoreductase [Phycisphaerales bacterium]
MITPVEVVQAQVEAYNAHDAVAMADLYSEDCVFTDLLGNVTLRGREAVRERFATTFRNNPLNRCWIKDRFSVGNLVVDHECGERAPGGEKFEVVAVYTVRDGLITRLMMGRGE